MSKSAWCKALATVVAVALVLPAAATAESKSKRSKRTSITQVGHEPLMDRGMNSAAAIHGDYAYIGSRTDGSHVGHTPRRHHGRRHLAAERPELLTETPIDARPGESSRELRVWRSQDILIVLNTNCGAGPTLHHCSETVEEARNVRFYDISGAERAASAADHPDGGTHPRVLPVGGPEEPQAGPDVRRQRRLDLRGAPHAQLPVRGLGHLAGAQGGAAGDALQRAARLYAHPADRVPRGEADRRPPLAVGQQRRHACLLRAADRRVRDRRHVRLRIRPADGAAAPDHAQRGPAGVGRPGSAQRAQAVEHRLGLRVRRGVRDGHRGRPRLPVGMGADGRHLRPDGPDGRGGVPAAGERPVHVRRVEPAADVVLRAQPDAHAEHRVHHLALRWLPGDLGRRPEQPVPAGGVLPRPAGPR